MQDRCGTCIYFDASAGQVARGICRRFPPQIVAEFNFLGYWPIVGAGDWCGEHVTIDGESVEKEPVWHKGC